jgi:hypothetical protein
LFALIVWTAARFPAAAGLMLTFPALNGLAFVFSRHDMVGPMTATMLWMPLVNGVLCVAYITAFIALATAEHATALAWGLAAIYASLWLAVATRAWLQRGVPARLQPVYTASVALVGAALTLAWWRFTDSAGVDTSEAAKPALTWLKVALFAIALTLLIVLPPRFRWKGGASGILSGLPLVVLGGLLNVAQDGAIDVEVRRALLAQMLLGVWLAPAMAVSFIFGVSRVVASPRGHELRTPVVVAGWVLCLAAIVATAAALRWLAAAA